MKVMLLAAGVGERMRPLTDSTPKPLLRVGGLPLIEHHIRRLAGVGLSELIINVSHLGEQICDYCGNGHQWGVSIDYSPEPTPLETAGGIINALELLGENPFMVVNGDVWTDYPFEELARRGLGDGDAHLVMVDNPAQHPQGDYSLGGSGKLRIRESTGRGYTYAGIGLYSPRFFAGVPAGRLALRPLLDSAIERGRVSGEYYGGEWADVGTPQRLEDLNSAIASPPASWRGR